VIDETQGDGDAQGEDAPLREDEVLEGGHRLDDRVQEDDEDTEPDAA